MPIHEETRAHPERLADDDRHTIAALLRGDERAYAELVDRHHGSLLRLAQTYVRTRGIAEEVVQETWLGVLRGLPAFEGRSSLRTWIHRILVNTATTRGVRESRTIPFSSITGDEPLVDSRRFLPADHPAYPGHWAAPPRSWDDVPEERLLADEARELVMTAIAELPASQRQVITLRDVEGWSSAEVREALDLSEGNQRVLLHRARAKVRARLEGYIDEDAA